MRTRGAVFLTAFAAALSVSVGALAATSLPNSNYHWAQPGTAHVVAPFADPPASISIATPARIATVATLGSSYEWAQPGTAPVTPSGQLPALISTG
jgi:hypothetical protein